MEHEGKVTGLELSIDEKESDVNLVQGIRSDDGEIIELGRLSSHDEPRGKQHSGFDRLEDDKQPPPPPPPARLPDMGDTATTASMSALPRRTGNFNMLLKELKTQGEFGAETARKRLKARVKKLKALDRVASIITVLQCSVVIVTGALAATAAETAWTNGDYEAFISSDWVTFCQSLTTLLSIASLLIFYIESRVEVIMKYPQKRWFWPWYFPSIVEACFEVLLYVLHCPPMIFNVPLIVCTSLRMILLFRLCKLHPDVRSIRFNQIMTGDCPSFSTFFSYKTVVRTSPLTAIFILAMITTPIILFIYLQTSRLDEGFSANPSTPLEVLWTIVWFVIAQQSPDVLVSARISAILAAIVSMALSTMIFTGLLGSLEMDSAQSAQYEFVYRKQVLEDVRNMAAKSIQTAFRYSKDRHPKMKKQLKKTLKAFKTKLALHIELREKDKHGGSVVHSISHLTSTNEELVQKLDRLKVVVEGRHAALYHLDTTLHSQTIANLSRHFESLLAKQEESALRQERAQNGAEASLSALQRDLHDVAVDNMKELRVQQAEYQKQATDFLSKITADMSQMSATREQDRALMQKQFQELLQSALQDLTLRLRASQTKSLEDMQTALHNETEKAQRQQSQQLQTQLDSAQQAHAKALVDLRELVATQQQAIQQLQQQVVGLQQQLAVSAKGDGELRSFQEQKSQELQRAIQHGFADLWGKVQSSRGLLVAPPVPPTSSVAAVPPAPPRPAPPAIPPRSPAPPPPPPR